MDKYIYLTIPFLLIALWRWYTWRDRCNQWAKTHLEDQERWKFKLESFVKRLTQVESERDEARKEVKEYRDKEQNKVIDLIDGISEALNRCKK